MSAVREIDIEADVAAAVEDVWNAWTTQQGAVTFFAPAANIDSRPGGAYEILFNPTEDDGRRGSEGMRILAMESPCFFSFTWNAPPHLPGIRKQMTFVEVRLAQLSPTLTKVRLRHLGWGGNEEWEDAFNYFSQAWAKVVLPRLQYSFETAPVDWSNPPRF